ncbi:MAG TPA: oligopeptide:H+ symporter [Steroidobacteraceae bacterium]|nr:oligopeptide:H+ symporter [Steroidobacteraceae bacterium]
MSRVVESDTSASPDAQASTAAATQRTFFGHPRGLATLFFTEMWERFTYYGIQSILILFLVAASGRGGLGFDDQSASAIWGLYLGGTYLLSLLGGWVADQLTGGRVALAAGGVLITIGNTMLASGGERLFFLGLGCNVLGVGLLKPNASNTVGELYPEGGSRRDAGFSIFYVGINVGSFLAPIFVPIVARNYGWHAGFALPAIGMLLGVAQFLATRHYLGSAGRAPAKTRPGAWLALWIIVAVICVLAALLLSGTVRVNPVTLASRVSWAVGLLLAGNLLYMAFFGGLTPAERSRVFAMMTLFAASTVFWMAYMQIFGSLTLFAARYTDLDVFGWQVPAGDLQTFPPVYIILLAPVFAALWVGLGKRDRDLSSPAKFAWGLLLMAAGMLVMYLAALRVLHGILVSPLWLITAYFVIACGELCLSPVGLSATTKLAPARFAAQTMGLFFLTLALGSFLAGLLSGDYNAQHLETLPALYLKLFWWTAAGGAVMLLLTPPVKRLMAGAR